MFPYREALVTGASRGLGKAFAEALLAAGVVVWGTSRDGARLPEGVRPLALDLGRPESIAACVTRLQQEAPQLDLLINNAGDGTFCPFAQFPDDELLRQWQVLFSGPAMLCRTFYPAFVARRHGAIVNVSSLAAVFPIPFMSVYSAAKAGLSAFSRTLMLEADGTGVVVIDLQPGDYATGFNDAMVRPAMSVANDPATTRAWARCERHLQCGPHPGHAARQLLHTLRRQRSRTLVMGNFWQARLGPLLARFAPAGLIRKYLKSYYNL